MKQYEIKSTLTEIREREDFLLMIKDKDNSYTVSEFVNGNRVYRLDKKEISFLKGFCIGRIEELKKELGPILAE